MHPAPLPATFPRGRRPALIPSNCSLSAEETEELVRTRMIQPLFPPPDLRLCRNVRSSSPTRSDSSASDIPLLSIEDWETQSHSPSSSSKHSAKPNSMPKSVTRDPRRRAAYLKARAQYARDRKLQQLLSPGQDEGSASPEAAVQQESFSDLFIDSKAHLRKHSAFVIDQELKSQLEARADTPHLSEVLPGEDVNVRELGIPGLDVLEVPQLDIGSDVATAAEGSIATKRNPTNTVTSMPVEEKIMKSWWGDEEAKVWV